MKYITVFCGSSKGKEKIFEEQAYLLGEYLAKEKIGIVYGGAKVGLMGALARGSMENKGTVVGVMPGLLQKKEINNEHISRFIPVDTMLERKQKMSEIGDGFIALPGGYGTMDELFEELTSALLGIHQKPIALLNVKHYFDPLLDFIAKMVDNGFLTKEYQSLLLVADNIPELINKMRSYQPAVSERWAVSGNN